MQRKEYDRCALLCLRLFSASGDMRTNGDNYLYEIQLSSITSSSYPACAGANICQVKPNDQHFSRKVGTSDMTKYYVQGNSQFPVSGSGYSFSQGELPVLIHTPTAWLSHTPTHGELTHPWRDKLTHPQHGGLTHPWRGELRHPWRGGLTHPRHGDLRPMSAPFTSWRYSDGPRQETSQGTLTAAWR